MDAARGTDQSRQLQHEESTRATPEPAALVAAAARGASPSGLQIRTAEVPLCASYSSLFHASGFHAPSYVLS